MNKLRSAIRLCFFLCSLLLTMPYAKAQEDQKWFKEYHKLETQFSYGKYYQASLAAKGVLKKMRKKGDLKSYYLATKALYLKNLAGMGMLIGNDTLVKEVFKTWDSTLPVTSDSMAIMSYLSFSSTAYTYSMYDYSLKYLDAAEKHIHKANDPAGFWAQKTRIARMELLIETMSYKNALEYIDSTIQYQVARTQKQVVEFDPLSNSEKTIELKRREYSKRKNTLGLLKVMKGDIYLAQGNLPMADSIYKTNDPILREMVKKKDLSYINNWYGYTQVQVLQGNVNAGLDLRNVRKKYANNSKYAIPNIHYFAIFENEIRADVTLGTYNRYSKAVAQYQREAIKNYPKRSIYNFNSNYLALLQEWEKGKFKSYGKHMNKLNDDRVKYYNPYDGAQISFLYDLANAQVGVFEYQKAQNTYLNIVEIIDQNNAKTSPLYFKANLELGGYYLKYTDKYHEADSIYSRYYSSLVETEFHPFHPKYGEFLDNYAQIDVKLDRFQEAITKYQQYSEIQKNKYGIETEEYAFVLEKLARTQIQMGYYPAAETNLKQANETYISTKNTKSLHYVSTLQAMGQLHAINGDFNNASKQLHEAYNLSKKHATTHPILPINMQESLAELYFTLGKYDQTEEILDETITFKKTNLGETNESLIQSYLLLGRLHLRKGELIDSEKALLKARTISKNTYGDSSLIYLKSEIYLGELYAEMGNPEKAISNYTLVMDAFKYKFGENYLGLAELIIKKAKSELALNFSKTQLLQNLDQATHLITINVNDHHPMVAEVTEQKAIIYIAEGNYDQALIQLQAANLIYTSTYGNAHYKTADNQINIAKLYYAQGKYSIARTFANKALLIYKAIFSNEHPKYISTLSFIGKTYYAQKSYTKAAEYLQTTTRAYLGFINTNFPALSESEKARYWASIKDDFQIFNSLVINNYSESPDLIGDMYNNQLATKALLLNATLNLKKRIKTYGSIDDINKYYQWIEMKDNLVKEISYDSATLDSLGINIRMNQYEINSLEKELSESAQEYVKSNELKPVTWDQLKPLLKPEDAAVEIVRVNYFQTDFTDSIVYVALIVDNATKGAPKMVILPHGNDMEERYFSYYQNAIKEKTLDKKSYEHYWELINVHLRGKKNIFLSSDGVYNQINPETFYTFNKTYLIDEFTFYFVSNTREIYEKSQNEEETYENQSIFLIGNPSFGKNQGNSITSIEPLPGAELEVKELSEIFTDYKWTTSLYVGDQATETILKTINSPRVLHIATHGFFMEDQEISGNPLNSSDITQNPLLRSGLLFSGASELLSNNQVTDFNQHDGILTAYEAMNLNLDNTEIVFLSACETGKGEVKAGEGVYGLQRSFIVAGAQNVVMTLFKVNDDVTQKLVNLFYSEWVKTGDKRQAFIHAKRAILEEYKSPIYWGSFILVGLD